MPKVRNGKLVSGPEKSDDQWFGGKEGAANKAFRGLTKQYGLADGVRVYFGLRNKRMKAQKGAQR